MTDDGGGSAGGSDGDAATPGSEPGDEGTDRVEAGRRVDDPPPPAARDREFGRRGWVLVAMIVVAFVLVPALLYFLPRASGLAASFGLSLRDAYLVLPLVPAVVLAVLAVWATTRP